MFRTCALLAAFALALTAAAEELPPPRDPMQPFGAGASAAAGVAAVPRLHLTAVLISTERRIAVVNGAPYQPGDVVAGAEIVRIEPGAVHVRRRGEEIVVPLGRAVVLGRSPGSAGEAVP